MCGRWRIGIEATEVNTAWTKGPYLVTNKDTGEEMVVYGFNYWAWVGVNLLVWPAKDEAGYSSALLDEWKTKFPIGSTLEVTKVGAVITPFCKDGAVVGSSFRKFIGDWGGQ
jgi:hypothetical protein